MWKMLTSTSWESYSLRFALTKLRGRTFSTPHCSGHRERKSHTSRDIHPSTANLGSASGEKRIMLKQGRLLTSANMLSSFVFLSLLHLFPSSSSSLSSLPPPPYYHCHLLLIIVIIIVIFSSSSSLSSWIHHCHLLLLGFTWSTPTPVSHALLCWSNIRLREVFLRK